MLHRSHIARARADAVCSARICPGCGGSTRPAAPSTTPDPTTSISTMKTTIMLAALTAAVLATTGCGGGNTDNNSRTTTRPIAAIDGRQIFTTVGCSNCHTLAAAGARGQVGPDLDKVRPTFARAVRQVTHGGGAMPPFSGQLSSAEIRAVARYVSANAGR